MASTVMSVTMMAASKQATAVTTEQATSKHAVTVVMMATAAQHTAEPERGDATECHLHHGASAAASEYLIEKVRLRLLHLRRVARQRGRILQSVVNSVAVGVRERHTLLLRLGHQLSAELQSFLWTELSQRLLGQLPVVLLRQLSGNRPILGDQFII